MFLLGILLLTKIVLLTKIIAIIIGFYYFLFSGIVHRLLLLQLTIAIICELYGYYIAIVCHQPNLWIFNIYMLFEIIVLNIVGILLVNNKFITYMIIAALSIVVAVWGVAIGKYSINTLANHAYIYGCISLVILYLYILFKQILQGKNMILANPVFWISISILIYFGCYIPYKGVENIMLAEKPQFAKSLFRINLVLNVIRYSLVAAAFYLYGSQARRRMSGNDIALN